MVGIYMKIDVQIFAPQNLPYNTLPPISLVLFCITYVHLEADTGYEKTFGQI